MPRPSMGRIWSPLPVAPDVRYLRETDRDRVEQPMRDNFFLGVAIGVGAALFGPALWKSGRPAIKGAVRAGIEGYGVARIKAAQFAEEVEDLIAEVAHEMHEAAAEVASAPQPSVKRESTGDV